MVPPGVELVCWAAMGGRRCACSVRRVRMDLAHVLPWLWCIILWILCVGARLGVWWRSCSLA